MKSGLYRKKIYLSAWGKIYRRELFQDTKFTEGIWYEDLDFLSRLLPKVKLFVQLDAPIYFYRQHQSSFMHSWSKGREDILNVTDDIYDRLLAEMPELKKAAADRRYAAHFFILGLMYRYKVNYSELERRCIGVIKEHRCEVLGNPRSRLKTRVGALVSYLGKPTIKILSKLVYK